MEYELAVMDAYKTHLDIRASDTISQVVMPPIPPPSVNTHMRHGGSYASYY